MLFRSALHARMKKRLRERQWQRAFDIWKHLRQQTLTSPELFLDAVYCLTKMQQTREAVQLLDESLRTYKIEGTASFFGRVGDMALEIDNPTAQQVAERAYKSAIAKLSSRVTQ